MSASVIKVLLIEDVPKHARQMRDMLQEYRGTKFDLEWVDSFEVGLQRIRVFQPDVLLLDLAVAVSRGSSSVPELQHIAPYLPVIILSSLDDEDSALKAVHQGAQDYLVQGEINTHLLLRSIRYAIERKRAEMALLQAEEKYRSIFENTIEGIFQTTPEGKYLSANTALARIYGYASPEELMSSLTNISRELYVEPGRRAEFVALMEKHDVVSGFESRVHRKDGSVIWISENVRAVRNRSGKLLYYEGTVEDITERRRHEEQLRNSETLYHSLVETLPQNIFRKNLNEQFTFANQRFCQTLGRSLDEIIGKTDFDFFPADLAAKYQKDDQLIIETGKMFEAVEENQPPGGEKAYVNVVKTPLHDAQGRIIGLQGIFWDITEKRRAEERLRQVNIDLASNREELRVKNQQMEEDLRMAREIQQAIIPQQYPSFPSTASAEKSVLSFCHRYLPTGAVGGDFFNIRPLSDTRAGVFICDVMGHGVRSALITAIVRALVEELTPNADDPGELLAQVNRDLRSILKQSGTPLFTTAFYMIADLAEKRAYYANAGHPKPMLIRRGEREAEVEVLQNRDQKSNPALGLFDSFKYTSASVPLNPGDRFVFFTDGNLLLSETAHLVFPYHRMLDEQREILKGKNKIGTTKRGIGPAYGDKAGRTGLRVVDLINPSRFELLLKQRLKENNEILKAFGAKPLSFKKVHDEYRAAGEYLQSFVTNTVVWLHECTRRKEKILFEGAQGTFLDIDHGTYPFVTSSNTTSGGACTGSGVPPNRMDRVVGVMKAYTTRVGEGPLPSEDAEISDMLHAMGREFGATTGRARRCGWFDAVATRHATMVNGIDELAVTNIDGLDTLDTIKVCTGYRHGSKVYDYIPNDIETFAKCQPVYADFPGWKTPTHELKNWKQMPPKAKSYLKAICELTGAKLTIASVGPAREQTLFL